jgi:hypothetical protein
MQHKLLETNLVTFILNHEVLSVNNIEGSINNIEVLAHIKKYNIERIELFKYVDINIKQIEKK